VKNDDEGKKADNTFKGISRRTFLEGSIATGIGALLVGCGSSAQSATAPTSATISGGIVEEPTKKTPVVKEVDVLVVGGGMAGVGAAVAAGRMGHSTLLVEFFGSLGGNGTNGMVNNFCGYASSSGTGLPAFQVVQGIGDEVLANLWARKGNPSRTSTSFNPEILKTVLDDMMTEANVEMLYYTQFAEPIMDGNTIKGAIIENKGGRQAILAKIVLDCTGDGDVCARAGIPFELGDGAGGFLAADNAFHIINVGTYKSSDVSAAIAAGIAAKDTRITRPTAIIMNVNVPGAYWVNWAGLPSQINGIDPFHLSKAAVEGRKIADGLTNFLKEKVAGFENVAVIDKCSKMGIRETRRVIGEYVLTDTEVLGGFKSPDGIGACAWPIEIVNPNPLLGRTFENLTKPQDYYLIPYGCLVPQKVENLLMAGRFVSGNHRAQASYRVMGPAVVMGPASGGPRGAFIGAGSVAKEVGSTTPTSGTEKPESLFGMSV
jgi:ribulose 1,5-bisphosphate synthetase/thiazole synthase